MTTIEVVLYRQGRLWGGSADVLAGVLVDVLVDGANSSTTVTAIAFSNMADPRTGPPIVALWAVPRSTSTAFEKVIRQRGDLLCFHEPFGEVWHCGDDDRCPPAHRYDPRPGLTLDSRWGELQAAALGAPVFIKDFAHHVQPLHDSESKAAAFLSRFRHSFLIRDPAKALSSLHRRWPDFTIEEAGFAAQRELFDRVSEQTIAETGSLPSVIDSDDLLGDPESTMRLWCEAVGLAHIPEALNWNSGGGVEADWYDGGPWHQELDSSTGINAAVASSTSSPAIPIEDRPELHDAYQASLPHYQALYQHRLSPG